MVGKTLWSNLLVFLTLAMSVLAKRSLTATSLVTCMDDSQISPSYFNVTFNPDDRLIKYSLDLTTEISSYIIAHVQVYAYGFVIIEKNIDMCDLGWKQFCPIYPGLMQVESIEYISKTYVDMIPGIAFTVPDIDAVAKVIIRDRSTGEQLSCLQASFSNGKTIAQTGAKWATAVVAGLGLLIAAVMSTFGNSNAALHISANSVSLFLYFQSVVVVSMQHVERLPPIALSWAENLAWSMGLIRIEFMQKIFRWYVQLTGGTPTLYFQKVSKQILVQRAVNYLKEVHKRALDFGLNSNDNLVVLRGIKRVGYNSHIEPTSIVVTGFTFFILIGYVLVVLLVLFKSFLELLIHFRKLSPQRFLYFRKSFGQIVKGSILRYIYIGFTQLTIFSFWEFTEHDSAAVIVLAVLFLLLSVLMLAYSYWQTLRFGKLSVQRYNNPATMLYGDSQILNKYGYCYTMFHAEKYWFGIVLIGYNFLKAIFIAFCQASGKTSVLVLFILDLAYTIYLIYLAPYLNKPTNVINYVILVVTTINSFLFLFFSDLFGQPASVSSIMGWIFFILNAAFALVLLVVIIVLVVMSVISKNPDARFAPAKDDRFSFQRKSSVKHRHIGEKDGETSVDFEKSTNELSALGVAAQDHSTNWESEMYRLNDMSTQGSSSPSQEKLTKNSDMLTPSIEQGAFVNSSSDSTELEKPTEKVQENLHGGGLTSKLKSLKRGLSRKNSQSRSLQEEGRHIARLSDTLLENASDTNLAELPPRRETEQNHNRNRSSISNISMSNGPTNTKDFL